MIKISLEVKTHKTNTKQIKRPGKDEGQTVTQPKLQKIKNKPQK